MCDALSIAGPASDDECVALAAEANAWIMLQSQTPFPGAVATINDLALSYGLYTASEGLSTQLARHLNAIGLGGKFETLYGPDLVNTPKQSLLYYERIFRHARIDPTAALVIDDSIEALRNAKAAGAHTVFVSPAVASADGVDGVIRTVAELPALLRRLE
jgi:HAD superfamily hydrolase (TIGR01509 family)